MAPHDKQAKEGLVPVGELERIEIPITQDKSYPNHFTGQFLQATALPSNRLLERVANQFLAVCQSKPSYRITRFVLQFHL